MIAIVHMARMPNADSLSVSRYYSHRMAASTIILEKVKKIFGAEHRLQPLQRLALHAKGDELANEREVVATVLHLLRSGRVVLEGNFRHASLDVFDG